MFRYWKLNDEFYVTNNHKNHVGMFMLNAQQATEDEAITINCTNNDSLKGLLYCAKLTKRKELLDKATKLLTNAGE